MHLHHPVAGSNTHVCGAKCVGVYGGDGVGLQGVGRGGLVGGGGGKDYRCSEHI